MVAALAPVDQARQGPEGGPLWRYDGGGRWTAVTDIVRTSNGLAWSPDGRTMYHADTRKKTVWAYDYDPSSGGMENKREFVKVDLPGASGPDGATVDRDGFYWVAVYGGGCVLRFDPDGKQERRINMPCRYPTIPAFGVDDAPIVEREQELAVRILVVQKLVDQLVHERGRSARRQGGGGRVRRHGHG